MVYDFVDVCVQSLIQGSRKDRRTRDRLRALNEVNKHHIE